MTSNRRSHTLHQGVVELRNSTALKESLTADVSKMTIEDIHLELVELYNHSFNGYSICVCSSGLTSTRRPSATSKILNTINTSNQNRRILAGAGDLVFRHILLKTMRDYFKERNDTQIDVGITERNTDTLREKLRSVETGRVLVLQIEEKDKKYSNIILVDASGSIWLIEPCDEDEELKGMLESLKPNEIKYFRDALPAGSIANAQPVCTLAAWFAVAMFVQSGGHDFYTHVNTFPIGTDPFYHLLLLFSRELFLRLALNMTNQVCVRRECEGVLRQWTSQVGPEGSGKGHVLFQVYKTNGEEGRESLMNISYMNISTPFSVGVRRSSTKSTLVQRVKSRTNEPLLL